VVEKEAKTVEEAVKLAIEELGVKREEVSIEVLNEGSKGIFGIIGVKNASVKVSYEVNYCKIAKEFIMELLSKMNIEGEVVVKQSGSVLNINISGSKMGLIIGNRGETLDSIQYLTSLVVNKFVEKDEKHLKVFLDAENYRQKRQEALVNLAKKLSSTVRRTGKRIELEPMNAYERRVIHCALENDKSIETYSMGDEPNRKVVITLKDRKDKNYKQQQN
jgi:spoIIIJ-associated protein